MPSIRFPSTALPLLPLCKGHSPDFIFRTYADLIGFVAAYGFHLVTNEGQRLPAKPTFADTPNAIGLEVFENRGLYANFLMIALSHDDTRAIAEDEDLLVKLIEQYCTIGAGELARSFAQVDSSRWLDVITDKIQSKQDDKILI